MKKLIKYLKKRIALNLAIKAGSSADSVILTASLIEKYLWGED